MPDGYFDPLPLGVPLDEDKLKQWLQRQTISAQKFLSGSVQSGVAIGSEDFVAGSAGWQIDGDGNAEFNDVTVRGEINASSGEISGVLTLSGTGGLVSAATGAHVEIAGGAAAGTVTWYTGTTTSIGNITTLTSPNRFRISAFGTSSDLELVSTFGDIILEIVNGDEVRVTGGELVCDSFIHGDGFIFTEDTDTGMLRNGANDIMLVSGGVDQARFGTVASGIGTRLFAVRDTTTGSAANVFINATTGVTARSTSALKYKTDIRNASHLADIKLEPVKFYREDDDRHSYGFIADWLGDQDELLGEYEGGEIENYDQRAVLAVLAAKINRLEERCK